MAYRPFETSPQQDEVLRTVRTEAADAPAGAQAVLDLDGCLFDTRPRQLQILKEFAEQTHRYALYRVTGEHFTDWSLAHTLINAGFDVAWSERVAGELQPFWFERFFAGAYVALDEPLPGAVRFCHQLVKDGLRLRYLTGRHTPMEQATIDNLVRFGFPWTESGATLEVKPRFEDKDEVFKRGAVLRYRKDGPIVLAVENEPTNANMMADVLSDALVVFVETDHSPRPTQPYPSLPRIRGFLHTGDQQHP